MHRCGIMATQLLATLTTDHHILKSGIVVYLASPRHLSHSISSDVCFVSQLKRCCYDSPCELILSWLIFEKIDSSGVVLFLFLSWLAEVLRARRQDNDGVQINVHLKCTLGHEDYTSLRFPFTLPYAWISGRDFCLVGVSCHIPSFWHCSRLASCVHHVYIFETWTEEFWKPQKLK